MIKLILIAALFMIMDCGKWDRLKASYTGSAFECVEGVKYIQFTSGATVMYNQDGTIKTCED